jgi:hypothetical protein
VCWCHLGLEALRSTSHSREACPREGGERESNPYIAHFRRFAQWIPALAGMTAPCNIRVSGMTPVAILAVSDCPAAACGLSTVLRVTRL